MRETLGPAWAYYVAFGLLFVWWVLVKVGK